MAKKSLKKKKNSREGDYVYVQLSGEEYAKFKRSALIYQMELINMLKSLKKYRLLKETEINLKTVLQSKIKEINESLKRVEANFPKIEAYKSEEKNLELEYSGDNLELQLEEIRKRLNEIKV